MIAEESTCEILSVARVESRMFVKFLLRNDNDSPYYLREIALMAEDPDVGEIATLYGNAGSAAELISTAENGALERVVTLVVEIAGTANVTAEIPSGVFVARVEFNAHLNDGSAHVSAEERKKWNEKIGLGENGKISSNIVDAFTKAETLSPDVLKKCALTEGATPADAFLAIITGMSAGAAKIAYGTFSESGDWVRIEPGFMPVLLFVGNTGFSDDRAKSPMMICWRGNTGGVALALATPDTYEAPYMSAAVTGTKSLQNVEWGADYVQFGPSGDYKLASGKNKSYVVIGCALEE